MRSSRVATDRLEMQVHESGPEDGVPVVLIHGNLSTGRFYEHRFADAPERHEESGHFPPIDAYERWSEQFFDSLERA